MRHPYFFTSAYVSVAIVFFSSVVHAGSETVIDRSVRVVAIDKERLVTRDGSADFRTLLSSGPGRALPIWSPEGSRIAFVQRVDKAYALADLVIVDGKGRELVRVPIEPVGEFAYAGMRYVEELRWLSIDRIAVRGGINPSQSQYYVFDTRTGIEVKDFIDDESSATFSPDGLHVASIAGSPHFSDVAARTPTLSIDDAAVFPAPQSTGNVEFLSAPVWSPDGEAVAIMARSVPNGASELVIWKRGLVQHRLTPDVPGISMKLVWMKSGLFGLTVLGEPKGVWSIDAATLAFRDIRSSEFAPSYTRALKQRLSLTRMVTAFGLTEPDFWCSGCDLAILSRTTDPSR